MPTATPSSQRWPVPPGTTSRTPDSVFTGRSRLSHPFRNGWSRCRLPEKIDTSVPSSRPVELLRFVPVVRSTAELDVVDGCLSAHREGHRTVVVLQVPGLSTPPSSGGH